MSNPQEQSDAIAQPSQESGWGRAGRVLLYLGIVGSVIGCAVSEYTRAQPAELTGEIDVLMRASAGDRGVFVDLQGFKDSGYQNASAIFYYRAVYDLFPQKVYVGDPSVVIVGPKEIVGANEPRDDDWLRRHDIGAVMIIRLKDGVVQIGGRPVEPVSTNGPS